MCITMMVFNVCVNENVQLLYINISLLMDTTYDECRFIIQLASLR